jgi:DNA polymerase-3 subunit beta
MKVEVLKEKIEEVVTSLEKITSKSLSLPVLQCVLLSTQKGNLIVKATNLDLGVEIKISAKIISDGTIAVPAETLKRFLSTITDKKIIIEGEKGGIQVNSEFASTKIKTLPSDDFPSIPKPNKRDSFGVDGKSLVEGFQSVWYSASPSSMKPELSSVYVGRVNGGFVFTATDSFRLAEKKVFGIKVGDFDSVLIPFKNIPEIIKFLNISDRKIEVVVEENQISFFTEDAFITSRTVDGTFPDYNQIIPKEFSTEIVVLKQDLVEALKSTQVFANKFNQVYLEIDSSKKKFLIYSKNEDVGENSFNLKSTIKGDPLEISFNYRYIMDCFQSIPQDSVALKMSGAGKPMVVSGIGDDSFTYLVMPMNR